MTSIHSKDRKLYLEIEAGRTENGYWILSSEVNCWVIRAFENVWHDLAADPAALRGQFPESWQFARQRAERHPRTSGQVRRYGVIRQGQLSRADA